MSAQPDSGDWNFGAGRDDETDARGAGTPSILLPELTETQQPQDEFLLRRCRSRKDLSVLDTPSRTRTLHPPQTTGLSDISRIGLDFVCVDGQLFSLNEYHLNEIAVDGLEGRLSAYARASEEPGVKRACGSERSLETGLAAMSSAAATSASSSSHETSAAPAKATSAASATTIQKSASAKATSAKAPSSLRPFKGSLKRGDCTHIDLSDESSDGDTVLRVRDA